MRAEILQLGGREVPVNEHHSRGAGEWEGQEGGSLGRCNNNLMKLDTSKLGTREGMTVQKRVVCFSAPAVATGLLLCPCQKLRHRRRGMGCAENQIPLGGCYWDSWKEMKT